MMLHRPTVILFGIAASVATIVDIFILHAFVKRHIWKKTSHVLIMSLLQADTVIAWMVFAQSYGLKRDDGHKPYMIIFNIFIMLASVLNIACVTVDRFFAIIFALKYKEIVTKRFTVLCLFIAWGTPLLILVTTTILTAQDVIEKREFSQFMPVIIITATFLAMLLLCITNVVTFLTVRRHIRSLIQVTPSMGEQGNDLRKEYWFKERRAAYLCSLIFLSFTLLWTPELIKLFGWALESKRLHSITLDTIAGACLLMNVFADISLYIVLNKDLRSALISTIGDYVSFSRSSAY